MKYISVKEASEKWGINERRVRALLKEQRIEGAILKDHKYSTGYNQIRSKINIDKCPHQDTRKKF